MNEESFWVIPDIREMRTPVAILNEQATFLTEKTKGVLKGQIETSQSDPAWLNIKLYIVAPALNNYRYQILQYTQPITLYPGRITWLGKNTNYDISDEAKFSQMLKEILSSKETQYIISGLLAQAMEIAPPSP